VIMTSLVPKTEFGAAQMQAKFYRDSLADLKNRLEKGIFKNPECRHRCQKTIDNIRDRLLETEAKLISNRR